MRPIHTVHLKHGRADEARKLMIRWSNLILSLMAIIGGYAAFRQSRLNVELSEQHRTLAAETGFLDISDPDKVHVVALSSEDPLHFRWRIYLPEKSSIAWRTSELGAGSHVSTGPKNFIAQVRFRKSEYGFVRMFTDLESRGGVGSLGGRALEAFLLDRWDEIETVQLGQDGPVLIEPQDVATLLRLRMPTAMEEEAKASLPASWGKQVVPILYEIRVGTEEAWRRVDRSISLPGALGQ